jgi:hypothetical protein
MRQAKYLLERQRGWGGNDSKSKRKLSKDREGTHNGTRPVYAGGKEISTAAEVTLHEFSLQPCRYRALTPRRFY